MFPTNLRTTFKTKKEELKGKSYFKEFNWPPLLKAFLFIIFIYLLGDYFNKGVCKFLIEPFNLDEVNPCWKLDLLGLIIVVLIIVFLARRVFKNQLIPSLNSFLFSAAFVIAYCLVFRSSNEVQLTSFERAPKFKYVDVIILLLSLLFLKFKYYGKAIKYLSVNGFIEDDFKNDDLLNREKYAVQIVKKILDTETFDNAFVIAINSQWGFGKTAFLRMIEKFLSPNNIKEFEARAFDTKYKSDNSKHLFESCKNTIIIEYNPWKNYDDKKTIEDFFNELSSSISKYDKYLGSEIEKYSAYLEKLDDSTFSKIVTSIAGQFHSDKTLTQLAENIDTSIQRIQKKIVVFIDDLDRLNGDELIDILKLIRNTANFRSTYFVIAYDHNYVLNTINKRKLISNKEDFLRKIVQLELTLPSFNKEILLSKLRTELYKITVNQKDKQSVDYALSEIEKLSIDRPESNLETVESRIQYFLNPNDQYNKVIFKVLENLRDITRFINSFKLAYDSIGVEVDLHDLIITELIKSKFLSLYQILSDRNFITRGEKSNYEFLIEDFKKLLPEDWNKFNIRISDVHLIEKLLQQLFNSTRKRFFRSIIYPRYFDFYFSYDIPNIISLELFEKAQNEGINEVITVIENSRKDNTYQDLRSFIESQKEFANTDDFELNFQILIYISKFDKTLGYNPIYYLQRTIADKEVLNKYYPENTERFATFLKGILANNIFDKEVRAEIAGDQLYNIVNNRVKDGNGNVDGNDGLVIINEEAFLQKILSDYLEEAISESKNYNYEVKSLYMKNLKSIDEGTRIMRLTPKANELMKNFIISNSASYLKKDFISEEPRISRDSFVIDPFSEYYFESWENVEEFIKSPNVTEAFKNEKEWYEMIKKAFRLFKDKGYKAFQFEDEKITRFMQSETRKQREKLNY